MIQPNSEVKTTKLSSPPFKFMRKIVTTHTDGIDDCTSALFPDGKIKIITCSEANCCSGDIKDNTLRVFDLKTLKCEKIINLSTPPCSIHYYKEEQVLLTTDRNGELILWNIPEIENIKKIKVSKRFSSLCELTQFSSNIFFCCAQGMSKGCLYYIELNDFRIDDVKVEEIEYPFMGDKKEPLNCIHKLISEENTILFSGGYIGGDTVIKKYNFETKKHSRFQKKHRGFIDCLTSFINEKGIEIVLSGGSYGRIVFWNVNRKCLKILKFTVGVVCFLNDFRRKNIFIMIGGISDSSFLDPFSNFSSILYSFNIETKKIIKNVEKFHKSYIHSLKWIDEENQNVFISCSSDKTINIFELEKLKKNEEYENIDLEERIGFIRNEEFVNLYFSSENEKKMLFSIKFLNNFRMFIFKVLLV